MQLVAPQTLPAALPMRLVVQEALRMLLAAQAARQAIHLQPLQAEQEELAAPVAMVDKVALVKAGV
jgi:hypothetical protein